MKKVLLCNTCGYKIPYRNQELLECPQCKSTEILIVPNDRSWGPSKSSGVDTKVMVRIIFGVIGGILLISGVILTSVDVGQSGPVVNILGVVIYLDPLGITFFVVGIILLAFVSKGECFEALESC